jgi:hypothetical protein
MCGLFYAMQCWMMRWLMSNKLGRWKEVVMAWLEILSHLSRRTAENHDSTHIWSTQHVSGQRFWTWELPVVRLKALIWSCCTCISGSERCTIVSCACCVLSEISLTARVTRRAKQKKRPRYERNWNWTVRPCRAERVKERIWMVCH